MHFGWNYHHCPNMCSQIFYMNYINNACSYSISQYILDAHVEIMFICEFNCWCLSLTIITWVDTICKVLTNHNIGGCYIKPVAFNFRQ